MGRVLIVDDDADFLDAVRMCLERAGHTVLMASNRAAGMKSAAEGGVDLLILDCMMEEPDDGIAMAQDLRRSGFTRPIIMMSSISSVTGLDYGKDEAVTPVDEFLEKPVPPKTLIETVAKLLARASDGEEKSS